MQYKNTILLNIYNKNMCRELCCSVLEEAKSLDSSKQQYNMKKERKKSTKILITRIFPMLYALLLH